jgi:hypothetical protein
LHVARIIVCGYMVRHPVAGNLLAYFHYVLGLVRLGHEVVYVEESGWPYSCYDPETALWYDHPTTGLRVVRALFAAHNIDVPVIYVNRATQHVDGARHHELERRLRAADLLLNIGGVCYLPQFLLCARRALVDMDPLFTQVERFGARALGDYHMHFSYGANIGQDGCTIPTCGVNWRPTGPPVVLDLWEWAQPPAGAPFTTVANWGSYGKVAHRGAPHGQKDEEFLRLIDLPRHIAERLELALSGADADADRLEQSGWSVCDAGTAIGMDVTAYREYIRASRGEFSVAKNAYVLSRSGWFSDRSVCYLAAGLPVVLQDTGFSAWLPTGRGLLAYRTLEEAADCLQRVAGDYASHRQAARALAAEVFAHDVVLPKLLGCAFGGSAP